MPWDLTSERSVYLQLIDIIKHKILSGEYKPGDRLISVRELAAEAAVNPNTMQRALAELEREGLLCTQRTNGRFISDNAGLIESARLEQAKSSALAFIRQMQQLGLTAEQVMKLINDIYSDEQ